MICLKCDKDAYIYLNRGNMCLECNIKKEIKKEIEQTERFTLILDQMQKEHILKYDKFPMSKENIGIKDPEKLTILLDQMQKEHDLKYKN